MMNIELIVTDKIAILLPIFAHLLLWTILIVIIYCHFVYITCICLLSELIAIFVLSEKYFCRLKEKLESHFCARSLTVLYLTFCPSIASSVTVLKEICKRLYLEGSYDLTLVYVNGHKIPFNCSYFIY